MKKLILAFIIGFAVVPEAGFAICNASQISMTIGANWEDAGVAHGIVSFKGSMRVSNGSSYPLRRDSETGAYQIYYNKSWTNTRPSDRDGFDLMFYGINQQKWYFNL